MEFIPAVAMLALVWKLIDFAKLARSGDANGSITQVISWAAGVGVLFLVAQTQWAEGINIGDRPLSVLDGWSIVFAGLTVASAAGVGYDLKRAIDNGDNARMPSLVSGDETRTVVNLPEH